jgi:hypothetical protein
LTPGSHKVITSHTYKILIISPGSLNLERLRRKTGNEINTYASLRKDGASQRRKELAAHPVVVVALLNLRVLLPHS